MDILTTIFYFIITIFIIVLIHEFGHFIAAKLCGMRVERFSIGFPPRAFGKTIGETDYCFSWIPIGGYVKISGMIDESFDTEFLNKAPEPYEFRSKPIYKRIFVITAGVIMNLFLSIAIFWGMAYFQKHVIWNTTELGPLPNNQIAEKIGFQENDRIITINGKNISNWNQIENSIFIGQMSDNVKVEILRNGQQIIFEIPKNTVKETEPINLFNPKYIDTKIDEIITGSAASFAGLLKDDQIISINKIKIGSSSDMISIIQSNAGNSIPIEIKRNGEFKTLFVTPDKTTKLIGARLFNNYIGPKQEINEGFFQSFMTGINTAYSSTKLFLQSLWHIITGKIEFSKAIGGPVKIAKFATQSAELGLIPFLSFIAMLSLTLAILNLLPFPALDGGHLVFLIIEGIIRREIPAKVKLVFQQIGFFVLLVFMIFVIFNDIFR